MVLINVSLKKSRFISEVFGIVTHEARCCLTIFAATIFLTFDKDMLPTQIIEEDMSRAFVYAIASLAGLVINQPSHDFGVDGTFRQVQKRGNRIILSGFSINYQLKATVNWKIKGDEVLYDMEVKTYNDLAERSSARINDVRTSPLILILLCLPKNQDEWAEFSESHLLMRRCCYWTMIKPDLTSNRQKVRIRIPRANLFTPDALKILFDKVKAGEI